MGTKNSLPLPLLLVLVFERGLCVTVTFDHRALVIDGKRRVLQSGSIHYPRTTPEVWPEIIRKSKEGGLDVIETYVFWNYHEPLKGQVVSQRNIGDVSSASTATINELSLAPSSWSWYEEQVGVWGNNSFAESGLLEQINTTKDVSDFLWYTKRQTVKCE